MNWRTFFIIFWTVVAVVTFSILGYHIHKAASEETYTMELIANDVAFGLTNALHVEGDVDIVYTFDQEKFGSEFGLKFDLEVENGIIVVKYDKYEEKANYIQNNNYKLEIDKKKGLVIHFKKRGF